MNLKNIMLTEEWINKMWYIYTMEYYSAIKKNEIMSFEASRMDLESVILSKISQTAKEKYCMTISRSIHVATNDIISFFLMAE